MEQNKNILALDRATQLDTVVKAGLPPGAENQNYGHPPPKAPKPPKVGATDDLVERAAIIEEAADLPRRWAEGYAALCAMPPPSRFSPERWRQVVDTAGIFVDRWGADPENLINESRNWLQYQTLLPVSMYYAMPTYHSGISAVNPT
ncbi:MAG: hypothetical protein AB7H71_04875 [Alphaproteobacteria bacterium]